MRAPHPAMFPRSCLAAFAAGSLALATATAAEGDRSQLDRLGSHFDQKAHDEAVAAEAARQAPSLSTDADDNDPDIVRLPRYVVEDKRVRLADHEVLGDAGRIELAKKRYLSPVYQETLGPLSALAGLLANPLGGWNPNAPEAMALYEQDEQIRRNTEMDELLDLEALKDLPASDAIDSAGK